MTSLLAFMVVVSCSDSFQDCDLAGKVQPYPSVAACEADIDKGVLTKFSNGADVLARCVPGHASLATKSRDNNKLTQRSQEKEIVDQAMQESLLGEISWQVSKHGDFVAKMYPAANDNIQENVDEAEDNSPFYSEDIASSGINKITYATAHPNKNRDDVSNLKTVSVQYKTNTNNNIKQTTGIQTLYSKGDKANISEGGGAVKADNDTTLTFAEYAPKIIYEQDSASRPHANKTKIKFADGIFFPLSYAGFKIARISNRAYSMSKTTLSILRQPVVRSEMLSPNAFAEHPAHMTDFYTSFQTKRG